MVVREKKLQLQSILPDIETDLANYKKWDGTLANAQARFKKSLGEGKNFPTGVQSIPLENIWIDYSVQRDVKPRHIVGILSEFDPRICMPCAGVKITTEDNDRVYIYDGQHRAVCLSLLGLKEIPVCIVETDEKTFPAKAFEVQNDTGIARASKGDIHKTLIYRYQEGTALEKTEPRVLKAHLIQEAFDKSEVDLTKKNTVTRSNGDKLRFPHWFSHFLYADTAYEAVGQEGIMEILKAYKKVFGPECSDGEVCQGLFIGLVDMIKVARDPKQGLLRDHGHNILPDNWMEIMLTVLKRVLGNNPTYLKPVLRDQWQHANSSTMPGDIGMSSGMVEIFNRYATDEELKEIRVVPNRTNVKIGIADNNLHRRCADLLGKADANQ